MSGAKRVGGSNWRGDVVTPVSSKKQGRYFLLFLCLGLVGLFAALNWEVLRPHPRTHLLIVRTGVADRFSAPLIVLEDKSIERLVGAAGTLWMAEGSPKIVNLQDACEAVRSLPVSKRDAVLVYVSANLVAPSQSEEEEGAYLLTQDFDIDQPSKGRVAVGDLLDDLASLSAACKLVVFDGGQFKPSARNGVLANLSASAVHRDIKSRNDPSLFSLTVCSDLESAGLGLADKASPLAVALARAATAPTALEDANLGQVTLRELTAYALATVGSNSGQLQTPQMQHASFSTDQIISSEASPAIAWRRLGLAEVDSPAPDAKDSQNSGDALASKSNSENPSPQTDGNQNVPPPQAGDAAPVGAEPVNQAIVDAIGVGSGEASDGEEPAVPLGSSEAVALDKAWSDYDTALFDAADTGAASSIQNWRLEGDTLLQIDLLTRGGSDLKGYDHELSAVTQRIAQLAVDRRAEPAVHELKGPVPPHISEAFYAFPRLIAIASELVRFDAIAVAMFPGDESTEDLQIATSRLLKELDSAREEYSLLCAKSLQSWDETANFLKVIGAAQEAKQAALGGFDRDFKAALRSAGGEPGARRRLEAMLQSTLLRSNQRRDAWNSLASVKAPKELSLEEADRYFQRPAPRPDWKATLAHAELENQLAALAGFPSVSAKSHAEVGSLGPRLSDFYRDLSNRLAENEDSPPLHNAGLAVLNSYDAAHGNVGDSLRIGVMPPETLTLTAKSMSAQRVTVGSRVRVEWEMKSYQRQSGSVKIELIDPSNGLESDLLVYRPGVDAPIRAGEGWSEPLFEGFNHIVLSLDIEGQRDWNGSGGRELPLKLRASSGELHSDATAMVVLPSAARIKLLASCSEPESPNVEDQAGALSLRLYPNRSTDFALALRNDADQAETVEVELYSVPPLPGVVWSPGLLISRLAGKAFPIYPQWTSELEQRRVAPIAKTSTPISLPANGNAVRIPFVRGATAPAEAKDGAEAPPPAPDDVTNGLLCVVNRQQGQPRKLRYWIELRPRHPSEYIDFATFVDEDGGGVDGARRVRIHAKLRDMNGDGVSDLPPGVAERPVMLTLAADCRLFPDLPPLEQRLNGIQAEVLRDFGPHERSTIRVAVDRYPRAMTAPVTERTGQLLNDDRQLRKSVKIQEVEMQRSASQPGVRYLLSAPQSPLGEPPSPEEMRVESLSCDRSQPCVFNVRDGGKALRIVIGADAPVGAFSDDKPGQDYVRVALLGDRDGDITVLDERQGFADRQTSTFLDTVAADGTMRLRSAVSDLEFEIEPQSGSEERRTLVAELYFRGNLVASDERDVLFDVKPPQITAVDLGKIRFGSKSVRAEIRIRDLSGVQRIEAWVTDNAVFPEGQPAQVDKPLKPSPASSTQSSQSYFVDIPVPKEPSKYYVYFRVTDACGKTANTFRDYYSFHLQPAPKAKPKPPPGPLVANLEGVVQLGTGVPASMRVYLEEEPSKAATSGRDGMFVIPDVKEGVYTIVAKGAYKNTSYLGTAKVALAKPEDYVNKIVTVEKPSNKPAD